MKNPIKLAGLLCALAIVAGACGGPGASTAPTTGATTGPAASTGPGPTAAYPTAPVKITMWTKEGEADGALQYAKKLAADYTALHANVTFTIVNKDVEKLREEFLASSLGTPPDLLWTVSDHIGPFTASDEPLIMPLDGIIDSASYVPAALSAVQADGKTWGAPISYGNQLMMYWNKKLAGDTAPADFTALIAKAKTLTDSAAGKFGLVFNQTESFWLVPFLGAFGGSVFDASGKPTLNTDAMKSALSFIKQLKYTDAIMPNEADYNGADGLFKSGKAAFIINGDWTLGAYADLLKDDLGLGPIPAVPGGSPGKPYVAGAFFMVGAQVADDADKLAVISDFVKWSTDKTNSIAMVKALKRLPGNAEAIADAVVTSDPLLKSAAEAATLGVGTPTNLEMRCVFDRMTTAVRDLFKSSTSDVDALVAAMQTGIDTDVAAGGKCGPA